MLSFDDVDDWLYWNICYINKEMYLADKGISTCMYIEDVQDTQKIITTNNYSNNLYATKAHLGFTNTRHLGLWLIWMAKFISSYKNWLTWPWSWCKWFISMSTHCQRRFFLFNEIWNTTFTIISVDNADKIQAKGLWTQKPFE